MNQNIVTESSKNIRALARVSLQGKWKLAVIGTLVYLVAVFLPSAILDSVFGGEYGTSPLSGLYSFVVAGPFSLGYSMFLMNLFRKKECDVAQVFYGFEKFIKAFALYFVMSLFIALWTLLFIIPGIIAAYRYSQCFLVMIDNPNYGILQCLSESKRIMTGNKGKLFCLEFSFIGWAILACIPIMVLGGALSFANPILLNFAPMIGAIGYLWLTPYMSVASIAFYELASGHLKPGVIEVEPISIEETDRIGE
ncbi:MAG: DUF975 family protein [Aminipila sp.]